MSCISTCHSFILLSDKKMKTENENEKNPKKRIQNKELKRKGKNFVNVFDMNFISPHFQ